MSELAAAIAASPLLALIPVAALLLAFLAYRANHREAKSSGGSLDLALRQDARREAQLEVRLISATCEMQADRRIFIYDMVVRNPSDRANAVAEVDLHFDYTVGGRVVTVKAPWRRPETESPPGALTIPINWLFPIEGVGPDFAVVGASVRG